MVGIVANNVSVVFPMVGSDAMHGAKLKKRSGQGQSSIGGRIILQEKQPAGILALDRLNLTISPGDRIGILGPNGSGKSTALRVLGGIYPPTAGSIEVNGKVSAMFSLNLGVNMEATGYENIELKGLLHGFSRREIKDLIPEIVEFSELGNYIHLPMKTYSSGMKMRLLFSIASAFKPEILLLDEWISTGDMAFRKKVDGRLEQMLDKTPIVIIASHNEKRLGNWANRLIEMNHGQATFLDRPAASGPARGKASQKETEKAYMPKNMPPPLENGSALYNELRAMKRPGVAGFPGTFERIMGPRDTWDMRGDVRIGRRSRLGEGFTVRGETYIGLYCSIGRNVSIFAEEHSHSMANQQVWLQTRLGFEKLGVTSSPVCIGHNVRIGERATIMSGVEIGHGAIIQPGAVVTSNIQPFEIVSGNPAACLGTRFAHDVVEALLEIKWWDWPMPRMRRNRAFFELDLNGASADDVLNCVKD